MLSPFTVHITDFERRAFKRFHILLVATVLWAAMAFSKEISVDDIFLDIVHGCALLYLFAWHATLSYDCVQFHAYFRCREIDSPMVAPDGWHLLGDDEMTGHSCVTQAGRNGEKCRGGHTFSQGDLVLYECEGDVQLGEVVSVNMSHIPPSYQVCVDVSFSVRES